MTDQQELNNILGGKTKRARPIANHRKPKGKNKKSTQQVQQPVAEETTVDNEAINVEQVGESTVVTYTDRVEVINPGPEFMAVVHGVEAQTAPAEGEGVVEQPAKAEPEAAPAAEAKPEPQPTSQPTVVETTSTKKDTVMYNFTKPEECFGRVFHTRTWSHLAMAVFDALRGKEYILTEPFRGMDRLRDLTRSNKMRAYNFESLVRHLGATMFGASVKTDGGYSCLTFGFDDDKINLVVTEFNGEFRFSFEYDEDKAIGRILSQKLRCSEAVGSERLNDVMQALDAAINAYHTRLFTDKNVMATIINHVKNNY